ncbi:MAG TPA: hypothetical protein VMI54_27235, partial [Polyangiaceae bacterium]|nr:hypothetical protein [Polyangiaceae bacterium]
PPVFHFVPRLTYAIAPPSRAAPLERRRAIARIQSARIASLPIDALLVYDVQDEAGRNGRPRPFAFSPKIDPLTYAFDELETGSLPRVVYRAVAGQSEQAFRRWLDRLEERGGLAVLVGAPSRTTTSRFTLPQAYALSRKHAPALRLGGVIIPERHERSGTEDVRVWEKMEQGCGFFVSQTVWSVSSTQRLLRDLRLRADTARGRVPPLLFTFSPCGSRQTLEFLEWLGVDVPSPVRCDLLSAKDMLARSVELAADAYAEISAFAAGLGLTIGCNVESVSTRTAEVEASLELLRRVMPHSGVQLGCAAKNPSTKPMR